MSTKQEHSSYPDPTVQNTGGSGPYRVSDVDADHQLRAHLEQEIQADGSHGSHDGPIGQSQTEQAYHSIPFDYGAAQMNLAQSPSTAAMSIAAAARPAAFADVGDEPPRKKTKVTRACDECRRKKIKCDAQSDTPTTPCSNCQRTKSSCLFSKPAQKRGPSRGETSYIKDLADRVNALENRSAFEISGLARNKRSTAEYVVVAPEVTDNGGENSIPKQALPYASSIPALMTADSSPRVPVDEQEKETLRMFMDFLIENFLPITVSRPSEWERMLEVCEPKIRRGFTLVLQAVLAIQSLDEETCPAAYEHLTSNLDTSTLSTLTKLVHLQSITLLVYAISYKGHPDADPASRFPLAPLFVAANAIISGLKLFSPDNASLEEGSDARLAYEVGCRCLLPLIVVNHWDAAGLAILKTFDQNDLTIANANEEELVGPLCKAMARQVVVLNPLITALRRTERTNVWQVNSERLDDMFELVRGTFKSPPDFIMAHTSLISIRLLKLRYVDQDSFRSPDRQGLVWARQIVDFLFDPETPDFPLAHHFLAIAARHIIDCTEVDDQRVESIKHLRKLSDGIRNGDLLRFSYWKQQIGGKVEEKLSSLSGLQNLAHEATRAIGQETSPSVLTRWGDVAMHGYLNSFI